MTDLKKYICDNLIESIKDFLNSDSPDAKSAEYLTLHLIFACEIKRNQIVKLFLQNGVEFYLNAKFPVIKALLTFDMDIIKFFVEYGINMKDLTLYEKNQILQGVPTNVLKYLLDCGLVVDATSIQFMVALDKLDVFKLLLNYFNNIDFKYVWKYATSIIKPLPTKIVNYLLESYNEKLDLENTKLFNIILKNETNILKKIFNSIPDCTKIITYYHLGFSCKYNSYDCAKLILELNIFPDINHKIKKDFFPGYDEKTPLESTIDYYDNLNLIKLLINYGAEITYTCLKRACLFSNYDIFYYIYRRGNWTLSQLKESLSDCVYNYNKNESIWKYLQKEIGENLDNELLGSILNCLLDYYRYKHFEYFISIYGTDRCLPLINLNDHGGLVKIYLKNKFNFF